MTQRHPFRYSPRSPTGETTSRRPSVSPSSRRQFLKVTAAAAGAALGSVPLVNVHAEGTRKNYKVALIGCGGRGNGALKDHLEAAKFLNEKLGLGLEIQVVAAADWFRDRALLTGKRYDIPEARCFGGADAYKRAVEAGPDIVLLAEVPAFRPLHFEAAVKAGKHVFFEKPVAVDPPGVRRVIQAGEEAKRKGLSVVAGTLYRHQEGNVRHAQAIEEGLHGRVLAGRSGYLVGGLFGNKPIHPKNPDHLVSSWGLWVQMSGDHIVEQYIHSIDIANWFIGSHPTAAVGFGYRVQRVAGNMYDFFSIDYEYPQNVHIHGMCRQVNDCFSWLGNDFVYAEPTAKPAKTLPPDPYASVGYHSNAYVGEHAHLLYAIVKEKPLNEARNVAWSSGTCILGRESAYSGQKITWDEMFENPAKNPKYYNLQLRPTAEDFEAGNVTLPKDGDIRFPGKV